MIVTILLKLEIVLYHYIYTVISYPMEVIIRKSILAKLSLIILSILYVGPLILETYVHLTYIIYNLWVDPVHLVDV